MEKPVTENIYIVENEESLGASLKSLFEMAGYSVLLFSRAEDFIDNFEDDKPHCILADIHLNGMSGMEMLKIIKTKYAHAQVILITGFGDIPMAIEALKNGAFDFIEKPLDTDRMLSCVGNALIQSKSILDNGETKRQSLKLFQSLSKREKEVFYLMVEGYTNKIMAHKLDITIGTIEAHRAHVMSKLKCNSLAEVIKISKSLEFSSDQHSNPR